MWTSVENDELKVNFGVDWESYFEGALKDVIDQARSKLIASVQRQNGKGKGKSKSKEQSKSKSKGKGARINFAEDY
eukprot:749299-Karenia_brevis.AAC.1